MPTRSITVPAGLDLKGTVRGAKYPVMVGPTEVWWSTRTPDGTGSLQLTRRSETELSAEAWGDGAEWLLNQAPRLVGNDDNPSGFKPEGIIGTLWRRKPFRLARTDTPWDSLVGGVLGQKVQVTKAVASRRAIARRFGERAPGPREAWILPSPATVGSLAYHDFHRLGVDRKRAEILIRVAREMQRMPNLTERSPREVQVRLEHIRGIGPWTAAMVTATAMGDPDAVPVGDFHIPNSVAYCLAGEPRADDARMLELLEPYVGHRWRVIMLAKGAGGAPKYGPRLSLTSDGLTQGR